MFTHLFKSSRRVRTRRPYRPLLEQLEDRVVPATFTVANTANSGTGSLRQAILDANAASGADRIVFAIPADSAGHRYYRDDGVAGQVSVASVTATTLADAAIADLDPDHPYSWWTIQPATALPTLSGSVVLDGFTQPGAMPDTDADGLDAVLRIELNNPAAVGNGLMIAAADCVVSGLVVNNFNVNGITASNAVNVRIQGNILGADVSGTLDVGNRSAGVSVTNNAPGFLIAGNLISGNASYGVSVLDVGQAVGASGQLFGNLIGTRRDGVSPLPNDQSGVLLLQNSLVRSTNVVIGGESVDAANVIAFNKVHGVLLVKVSDNRVIGNRIFGNLKDGVEVQSGVSNAILSNHFHDNGTLAIDLSKTGDNTTTFGVTENDSGDADTGANNVQNYPVLTDVDSSGARTVVRGTLNSLANRTFLLQFYANPTADVSSHGEGARLLGVVGAAQVTTDATGNATFEFTLTSRVPGQELVAATATLLGSSLQAIETSEFSLNFVAPTPINRPPSAEPDTYTVAEDVPTLLVAPTLLANDSDPDGDALSAELVDAPQHGTVQVNADGTFSYQSAANYNGPDRFTYRVRDGQAASAPVEVTLTVSPINDVPSANGQTQALNQDEAAPLLLTASDGDPEVVQQLTFAISVQPLHGQLVGFEPETGRVVYFPDPDYVGTDSFQFTVTDDATAGGAALTSQAATIELLVLADDEERFDDFGDAPETYGIARHAATGPRLGSLRDTEDATASPADGSGDDVSGDDDEDGVVLTVLSRGVTTIAVITVGDMAGFLNVWLDVNQDGDFLDDDERLTPATGLAVALGETEVALVIPYATFPGPTFARFRLSSASGLEPFGLADDGEVEDYAVVVGDNNPPFADPQSVATDEDIAISVVITGGDSDANLVELTEFFVFAPPAHGILSSFNAVAGTVGYTPDANYHGDDSFTFGFREIHTDGTTAEAYALVALTVRSANDDPIISSIADQLLAFNAASAPLTFTVGDVETPAENLSVTVTSSDPSFLPERNITLTGSGAERTIRVAPVAGRGGQARVTLTVADANGGQATSEFVVGVASEFSDAPLSYGFAQHLRDSIRLGEIRDVEPGPAGPLDGTGDNADGLDDEDGVVLSPLRPGGTALATATVVGDKSGYLQIWIDLNQDGDFLDPAESVTPRRGIGVKPGVNRIALPIDVAAQEGTTFARFRLSLAGDLGPAGVARDGEVEDYRVTIARPQVVFVRVSWTAQDGRDPDRAGIGTAMDYDSFNRLEDALEAVATGGTVRIAPGRYTTNATIRRDVTLVGTGTATILQGQQRGPVLQQIEGAALALRNLVVSGGLGSDDQAGGIDNRGGGPLSLSQVIVRGNRGPGVAGIASNGTLSLVESMILENEGGTVGGLFVQDGEAVVLRSTIASNSATAGTGGVRVGRGQLSLLTSTVSGNHGEQAGGVRGDAGATLIVRNSTITDNQSPPGPGGLLGLGTTLVDQTIIAGNRASERLITGKTPDVRGGFTSQGYNLIGDATGAEFTLQQGDLVGTAATPIRSRLLALASNGGFTLTHELRADSPAVDAGSPLRLAMLDDFDQVGRLRTLPGQGRPTSRIDIGAVEGVFVQFQRSTQELDHGNAPASYGDPTHIATGSSLGLSRGGDAPALQAQEPNGVDGVTFSPLARGGLGLATVTVVGRGRLDAWIDFDRSGTFEARERLTPSDGLRVEAGANRLEFSIPVDAMRGQTYARFRLSNQGGLSPTEAARDGEVEDYAVTLDRPATVYIDYLFGVSFSFGLGFYPLFSVGDTVRTAEGGMAIVGYNAFGSFSQRAVDVVQAGGTLRIAPGTYFGNAVVTRGNVNIVGAGRDLTQLNSRASIGGADVPLLDIRNGINVEVSGLSFGGGDSEEGGVIRTMGFLTVNDCRFERNRAAFGGAIYSGNPQSILTISDTELSLNRADRAGGAIFSRSAVLLRRVEGYNNRAGEGGFLAYEGPRDSDGVAAIVAVAGGRFANNEATSFNGGAFALGPNGSGSITLLESSFTNVTIAGNRAADSGGGIAATLATLSLIDCNIEGNVAQTGGGIAMLSGGVPEVGGFFQEGGFVQKNQAIKGGGLFTQVSTKILGTFALNEPDDIADERLS